jgi:prevent-host-death family protein
MEHQIGATDLRQQLTDVLQTVREERAMYVIETFGRPQAALVNLDEYRRFQQYQQERETFFNRLDAAVDANATRNVGLSEADILALIEQARQSALSEK